nr:hypothetical protein [Tanacetum cinerariifolium]
DSRGHSATKFVPSSSLSTKALQNDDELSDKELKQIEAVDQAIQTILHGLPEDIYVVVDSCKTAQEIWLRNDLRKLKGKTLVDNVVTSHTIDLEMLKIDVEPLAAKLLNNRTVHSDCLRHTQEQVTILREVVEQGKSQNPLNNSLEHA